MVETSRCSFWQNVKAVAIADVIIQHQSRRIYQLLVAVHDSVGRFGHVEDAELLLGDADDGLDLLLELEDLALDVDVDVVLLPLKENVALEDFPDGQINLGQVLELTVLLHKLLVPLGMKMK